MHSKAVLMLLSIHCLLLLTLYSGGGGGCIQSFFCDGVPNFCLEYPSRGEERVCLSFYFQEQTSVRKLFSFIMEGIGTL